MIIGAISGTVSVGSIQPKSDGNPSSSGSSVSRGWWYDRLCSLGWGNKLVSRYNNSEMNYRHHHLHHLIRPWDSQPDHPLSHHPHTPLDLLCSSARSSCSSSSCGAGGVYGSSGSGGGMCRGGSGGDGSAAKAVHLARRSPVEGGDSEASGDGDGVGMARSLSTSASGGKDMAA
nr:hypothetical protein [Tanacetum cinerariifolium]